MRDGLPVLDCRVRFGNYFHLMREIVHLHQGWMARVPSIDVKALLGIHVFEDAVFVRRIRERLQELEAPGTYPASPGAQHQRIIDFLNGLEHWEAYIGAVYSVIKPGLIDAWEAHFTSVDPLIGEPSQRLIASFMHVTSQHISGGMTLVESLFQVLPESTPKLHQATGAMRELWAGLGGDFGSSSLAIGQARRLARKPALAKPAREPFLSEHNAGKTPAFAAALHAAVKSAPDDPAPALRALLHDQLNREIVGAELYSLTSHENPGLPWEFHEDMARMTWDRVRHAQVIEKILVSLGGHWGEHPVDLSPATRLLALDARGRISALADGNGQTPAPELAEVRAALTQRGLVNLATFLDHHQAELVRHQRLCQHWLKSI